MLQDKLAKELRKKGGNGLGQIGRAKSASGTAGGFIGLQPVTSHGQVSHGQVPHGQASHGQAPCGQAPHG
jgi:hypothetical protein